MEPEEIIRRTEHTVGLRVMQLLVSERALQRDIDRLRADLDFDEPDRIDVETTPAWAGVQAEVTVVIPVYNQRELVIETITSAVASTGIRVEVVVVDDHSYDGSLDVVRRLMADHPWAPIAVARKLVNEGLGAARNNGFELARAPLVFPLATGNTLYPTGLAKLAAALEGSEAAFSYGIIERFGGQPGLASYLPWDLGRLCQGNYIEAMALVRQPTWAAVGGYDPEMSTRFGGWEDYDLWLRIAERGGRGTLVPEIVARHRQAEDSMLSMFDLDASLPIAFLRDKYPLLPWPAP